MNTKLAMAPPFFLLAVVNGFFTCSSIAENDYSNAAFTGAMSFLTFHLGLAVLKYGVKPYRVVPALFALAITYAAWGVSFFLAGAWAEAFTQFVGCVVWGYAAKKANDVRRIKEAEDRAKNN